MTRGKTGWWGAAWLAFLACQLGLGIVGAVYGDHLRGSSPAMEVAATGQVVQTAIHSRSYDSPPFFVTEGQWWLWTALDAAVFGPLLLIPVMLAWAWWPRRS